MKGYFITEIVECSACDGTGRGKDKIELPSFGGEFRYEICCGECRGSGEVASIMRLQDALKNIINRDETVFKYE